jgi:hypothetical protein
MRRRWLRACGERPVGATRYVVTGCASDGGLGGRRHTDRVRAGIGIMVDCRVAKERSLDGHVGR